MEDEVRNFGSLRNGGMLFVLVVSAVLSGCGTTVNRGATEQLLASDAVDRSVSEIDFRDLAGQKIFLDTTYIKNVKSVGFVNSDYIISSLRQQLVAADCRLQETKEKADFVVEARVGALGSDRHEIVWGMPANNLLGTVATAVPTAPILPPIPEISVAKKTDEFAVAKIGVFAYHRETGQPIWQSGTAQSKSTARNTTVFGVGPFQSGTIHEGTEFAGSKIGLPLIGEAEQPRPSPVVPLSSEVHFVKSARTTLVVETPQAPPPDSQVQQVSGESTPVSPPAPLSVAPPVVAPPAEPPVPAPAKADTALSRETKPSEKPAPPEKQAPESSTVVKPTEVVPTKLVAEAQEPPSTPEDSETVAKPQPPLKVPPSPEEDAPAPVAEHHSIKFDGIVIIERKTPVPEKREQADEEAEVPPKSLPNRDNLGFYRFSNDYDQWLKSLSIPSTSN